MLDRLCDDQVFYVDGFLVVEGMNSAYFTTLTPQELVELGTELVVAGQRAQTGNA